MMEIDNEIGIVYLLTNPAMPRLIKIGSTTREHTKIRMDELYSTGVPVPFVCAYAAKVKNPAKVEDALHIAFSPNRINPRREFFEIEASQAISILKLLEIENSTIQIEREVEMVDAVSLEAGKAYSKKRPRFNFVEMGIPIGSQLICTKNGEEAIVNTDRTVIYKGEITSLTNATRIILGNAYHVAPGPYWEFNGKRLSQIYDETYIKEE